MEIIKRDGSKEAFDRQKIKNAIMKANNDTKGARELSERQIDYIALVIEEHCMEVGCTFTVEEIQELVETHIILQGASETAKRYIRYRYIHNLARSAGTTANALLTMIDGMGEENK